MGRRGQPPIGPQVKVHLWPEWVADAKRQAEARSRPDAPRVTPSDIYREWIERGRAQARGARDE